MSRIGVEINLVLLCDCCVCFLEICGEKTSLF